MAKASDIVWHDHAVRREDREAKLGQRGAVVWFTGLSGCGKSTIANELDRRLNALGRATMLLDGDNLRHGLCAPPVKLAEEHSQEFAQRFGLGFGEMDREENLRRIGAVAALMTSAGLITLAAFVSPYRRDRDRVRRTVERSGREGDFLEVFVDTPLEICEARDPKGLYRKARAGNAAGRSSRMPAVGACGGDPAGTQTPPAFLIGAPPSFLIRQCLFGVA
jgi:adenylylsulfate kinase